MQYQNRDWLYQKYVVEDLSAKDIAEFCDITYHTVQKWTKKLGLKKQPSDEFCSYRGCVRTATRYHGHATYCDRHNRFVTMHRSIRNYGRRSSITELEQLFEDEVDDMLCPCCRKTMIWHRSLGKARDVVTVQHWTADDISFLCMECNSRHGGSNNKNILDISRDQKWCPKCSSIKLKIEFHKDCTRGDGLCSFCKPCAVRKSVETRKRRRCRSC